MTFGLCLLDQLKRDGQTASKEPYKCGADELLHSRKGRLRVASLKWRCSHLKVVSNWSKVPLWCLEGLRRLIKFHDLAAC